MSKSEISRYPTYSLLNKDLLLNQELRLGYCKIPRWQDDLYKKANPNFFEDDLLHVFEMRNILNGMQTVCPFLKGEVNFDVVARMIDLHDIEEINTRDILALYRDDNCKDVKHKRQAETASQDCHRPRITCIDS